MTPLKHSKPRHQQTARLAAVMLLTGLLGCSQKREVLDEWQNVPFGMQRMYDLEKAALPNLSEQCFERHFVHPDAVPAAEGMTVPQKNSKGEWVVFEENGPGCLGRLWLDDPDLETLGPVNIYLDNRPDPAISYSIPEMFGNRTAPFLLPVTGDPDFAKYGCYTYLPIPFRRSLRITLGRRPWYGSVSFRKFNATRQIASFEAVFPPQEQETMARLTQLLQGKGDKPYLLSKTWKTTRKVRLAPKVQQVIYKRSGAGLIRGLYFTLTPPPKQNEDDPRPKALAPADLRNLWIEIYWDKSEIPAVRAPLADLFANGLAKRPYTSLPMGYIEGRYYMLFPMPFRSEAKIMMQNHGAKDVDLKLEVVYQNEDSLLDEMGWFHAAFFQKNTRENQDPQICRILGSGHYVGTICAIQAGHTAEFLEGDLAMHVDGHPSPLLHASGLHAYFGIPATGVPEAFALPYHGMPFFVPTSGMKASHFTAYRFHLSDRIPFKHTFTFSMKHGEDNAYPLGHYSVLAMWYQDAPAPVITSSSMPTTAQTKIWSDKELKTELIQFLESNPVETWFDQIAQDTDDLKPWRIWRLGAFVASLAPSKRDVIEAYTKDSRSQLANTKDPDEREALLQQTLEEYRKLLPPASRQDHDAR